MQNYDNLGQVFKNLRTNRHISLKQISNERVSAAQISRFERGESDISLEKFLIALALCGVGLAAITVFAVLGLPAVVIVSGNLVFEFFLTIFNIHFFSMVQKKMPKNMLNLHGCSDLHADFNSNHDSIADFHQHLCVCGDRGGDFARVRWCIFL